MSAQQEDTLVKKSKKAILVTFFIIFIVLFTFISGIVTGYFVYTRYFVKEGDNNNNTIDNKITVLNEENTITSVVEKTKDSVVSIAISQLQFTQGQGVVDSINKIGTGFVVDKNGLIITNQHVVETEGEYKVITSNGDEYDVTDIYVDNVNDLALLKVNSDKLTPIELGDSEKLKVGQLAIAIGTPLGEYAGSVTTGIVSGLNRTVETGGNFWSSTTKTYYDVIQTDAAVNPGNSGGPLLNSLGQVIGVNFATTSGADNISFALPVNVVKKRIDEYRKYGKFIKPYLGVEYQYINEFTAKLYKLETGAFIIRVAANSPAQKAGLKREDIIKQINGKDMDQSLANALRDYNPGDELTLKVSREGKVIEIKVKLGESE